MGAVWAAINDGLGGEVAIKLILHSTDELKLRLQREARACGALKHRNVIDVYDVGTTDDGDPFLVMQLLNGETLGERLARQRRIEPQEAAQIARDVAKALEAAHGAGIVHRDLKPANIYLHREAGSDGPVVKVLDFGVSKNVVTSDGLMTVAGGVVGSPAYMSPEQTRGDANLDARADIWSLGVVLYEMLTGVRPFQGDSVQILAQIAEGNVPPVTSKVRRVDPGLSDLVARCLERDRNRRVSTAAELVSELQRYATSAPGAALGQSGSALSSPFSAPSRSESMSAPISPFVEMDASTRYPRAPVTSPQVIDDDDEPEAATAKLEPKQLVAMRRSLEPPDLPTRELRPAAPMARPIPQATERLSASSSAWPALQPAQQAPFRMPPAAPEAMIAPPPPLQPPPPRAPTPSMVEITDPNAQVTKHGTVRISPDLVKNIPPPTFGAVPPTPPPPPRVAVSSSSTSTAAVLEPSPASAPSRRTGVIASLILALLTLLAVAALLVIRFFVAPTTQGDSELTDSTTKPSVAAPPAPTTSSSAPATPTSSSSTLAAPAPVEPERSPTTALDGGVADGGAAAGGTVARPPGASTANQWRPPPKNPPSAPKGPSPAPAAKPKLPTFLSPTKI